MKIDRKWMACPGRLIAATMLLPHGTALAAPEQDGVLPPVLRDVMVVLALVLAVLLLIAVAVLCQCSITTEHGWRCSTD